MSKQLAYTFAISLPWCNEKFRLQITKLVQQIQVKTGNDKVLIIDQIKQIDRYSSSEYI